MKFSRASAFLVLSVSLEIFSACSGPDDRHSVNGDGETGGAGGTPGMGGRSASGGAPSDTGGAFNGSAGSAGASLGGRSGDGGEASGGTGGTGSGGLGGDGNGGMGGTGSGGEASGGTGGTGGTGGNGNPGVTGPLFPAHDSVNVCPDPSLRMRFDDRPTLGSSGMLRVYDAANPADPVASIDMARNEVNYDLGGSTFKQPRPAYVHENEAIFVLPPATLSYGRTYYVTVDPEVVSGSGDVPAVTDPNSWRFTTAPSAPGDTSALKVALDGTGQFCSVQGAVEASGPGTVITMSPGAYYGLVYFKNKSDLTIRGNEGERPQILGVNNNNLNPSTRGRALFGAEDISGLTLEHLLIHNQTPQGGSQAEALALLDCDRCVVRHSTIKSLQDTLLWSGRLYAEDCLIEGNVDYIWGTGTAYFNRCEIKTVGRSGYILQARNSAADYGYVFVDSKLTSDPGISGDLLARIDVSEYPASHVAFINCEMGSHIAAEGFRITGGGSTASLRFWEYQSRGPGGSLLNTSGRVAGSRQLSESEAASMRDPSVVLGGWDPN